MHPILSTPQTQELVKVISKLRTTEEISVFLGDFFSPKEIDNLTGRWQAVSQLSQKHNYLDIQKQTGLSSATIAKMSNALKYGSGILSKLIERMR
jgi:TrpR family transcriptional regulator, trp operon repressor